MKKTIRISMQLTHKEEFVSIPVSYITEQENENVTVYNCSVNLHNNDIPDWLEPTTFSIRKVYKKPITHTSIKPTGKWANIDAALFADETMKHIRVKETYKSNF
jgi:hypothetical protein